MDWQSLKEPLGSGECCFRVLTDARIKSLVLDLPLKQYILQIGMDP